MATLPFSCELSPTARWLGVGTLLTTALLAGCSGSDSEPATAATASTTTQDAGPEPPPRVCQAGGDAPLPWFVDATAEVGLAATADYEPNGTCMVTPDLDGDGYSDLISLGGNSSRGLIDGRRVRFVMMNRPAEGDPTKRVYVDVPDQAGLLATREGTQDRGASIAIFGDLNNDGWVDVITCPSDFTDTTKTIWDPCSAFLNDGTGRFTLAPPSDLDGVYPAPSAVLFDYDKDGILDFWPAGISHWPYGSKFHDGPRLFKGNGDGTFHEVTAEVGLPVSDPPAGSPLRFRPTLGITTCDLDGDGDQDVVTSTYGREPNQAWRNDGGAFVAVGHDLGLDHDDREDYTDDQSYRCYCKATGSCDPAPPAPSIGCNQWGNPYLRGWIPGKSDTPEMLGGNNMGVTCTDVDDDGDQDVVFATIVHGDVGSSGDPTEIITNPGDGTKFVRLGNEVTGLTRPELGITGNHYDHMATFSDVDLDGRKDALVLDNHPGPNLQPWFWRQNATGKFEEITGPVGLLPDKKDVLDLGAAWVDVDGDGDLDLVAASIQGPDDLRVYRNVAGQGSNALRVRLVGMGAGHSNVSAIGARVRVTAGGRTQTLEVKGGQGLSNIQGDFVLTFGLGAACDVDEVEVQWPDAAATVTKYTGVRANYPVVIREGATDVEYVLPE